MSRVSSAKNQTGFTLVELMLATALFSFILMFATAGFVQINRAYNKGQTVKRMHQSAREVIEEISRSMLESTSEDPIEEGIHSYGGSDYPSEWLCIDGGRVVYEWVPGYVEPQHLYFNLGREFNTNNCGPIGDDDEDDYPSLDEDGESMLDELIAVQNIEVTEHGSNNTYEIIVRLASNDENADFDVGEDDPPCEPTDPYCDFVELSTVITLRR